MSPLHFWIQRHTVYRWLQMMPLKQRNTSRLHRVCIGNSQVQLRKFLADNSNM